MVINSLQYRRCITLDEITLFTTGYEGSTVSDFIEKLHQYGIDIVIDVREIPISRKKGFSKSALKDILTEDNIEYVHYKELGSPKDIRHRFHEDGNFYSFRNEYLNYIREKLDLLDEVKSIVENEKSCLLCFEKEARLCHRSIIADMLYTLSNNIVKVVDL